MRELILNPLDHHAAQNTHTKLTCSLTSTGEKECSLSARVFVSLFPFLREASDEIGWPWRSRLRCSGGGVVSEVLGWGRGSADRRLRSIETSDGKSFTDHRGRGENLLFLLYFGEFLKKLP